MSQSMAPQPRSHSSPHRQHHRTASAQRIVKETHNARTEYSNSHDDGASQHRINQYLICEEIGRGSFGAVHLAIDQYGQEYAVKEFSKTHLRRRAKSSMLRRPRQHVSQGPGPMISAFQRTPQSQKANDEGAPFELIKEEIAIMKKLNHPNLVSLIEVLDDPDEDSLYMVLEMCKKGVVMKVELDQDADPYTEEECRTWFRDLILAIEYLHAQGVVHRDIKPDNCLLTEDDTLKVVDFGVSELFEKDTEMKVAKSAGSPAFMAPELCTINKGDVFGKPADIWSMGVTLYCLRFGRVPFKHTSVLDLYHAISDDSVEIPEDCSEELADLLIQLLKKEPRDRIKMEELREHPWVTCHGSDPLLSAETNCSNLVSMPTEEEKNDAITGNVGRILAVIKAVNKFKALVARRRPDLIEGMLGRASHIVQPPLSMSKVKKEARQFFGWPHHGSKHSDTASTEQIVSATSEDRPMARSNQVRDSPSADHDQRDPEDVLQPAEQSSISKCWPDQAVDDDTDSKSYGDQQGQRGHAHDPLKDHLYLHIGPNVAEQDEGEDNLQDSYIVSESPRAVEGEDIYAEAYRAEVERIRQDSGHDAVVYLTRRIEKLHDAVGNIAGPHEPKKHLAGLFRRAAGSNN